MVLTGVGATNVAKERQAQSTDSICLTGVADLYETKPRRLVMENTSDALISSLG